GTSEDAAQKRVSRALEKLRQLLAERGVALSAAALGSLLVAHSVAAAPAGWGARIGAEALASAPVKAGLLASFLALFTPGVIKMGMAALVAITVGTVVLSNRTKVKGRETETVVPPSPSRQKFTRPNPAEAATTPAALPGATGGEASAAASGEGLRLSVQSAATGEPIPNGSVELRGWQEARFLKGTFVTDLQGNCIVAFPRATVTEVQLTTRIPAYADTRLLWRPKQGDKIPEIYTLRLEKGIPIGGLVINEQGEPVAGAKVGFNNRENGMTGTSLESHSFAWIEVESDSAGRWSIDRIAADTLRAIYGGASHPDYVGSEYLDLSQSATAEKKLRDGTFVFKLGNAVVVRGVVLDRDRNPVSGAAVLVGPRGMSGSRETTAALDGTFEARGVKPGKTFVTAQAPQFAPTSLQVEISSNTPPVELVLQGGNILRLRVVNPAGEPLAHANVWLDTMDRTPDGTVQSVQADFSPKTDPDGRVFWDQAPSGKLRFSIAVKGYSRRDDIEVEAGGSEHMIVLQPGLKISGTVTDSATGKPIPRFRIVCGWPQTSLPELKLPPHWSNIDRHTLAFTDGRFEYLLEEQIVGGTKEWKYIFRFEAEGYASFVSPIIDRDNGEARLDVKLDPSQPIQVQVLNPDGTPAAGASVVFAAASEHLRLGENGFALHGGPSSERLTDSNGVVAWQPDETSAGVYALNDNGFGRARAAGLRAQPMLQLQAWGRVEGKYNKRGQPVVGVQLVLTVQTAGQREEPYLFLETRPKTDAQGHFEFARVPPLTAQLAYMAPAGGRSFTHVPLKEVKVLPGQTTTVDLAEEGSDVIAQVRWPEGTTRPEGGRIFAGIHTPTPRPSAELIADPEGLRRWRETPEIAAQFEAAKHWMMNEINPGSFKAEAVAPGTYFVTFNVASPASATEMFSAQQTITVSGEEPGGLLDLGEVNLLKTPLPARPASPFRQALQSK
ncbi:MAG TPA: carboxypeptidase-like regulatory domain-containing protein, partial [Verrucomicrobiae bacterium]|nr:carboxypeptidase-like regulatory domain-containing protein [Verrucomicrobiae bacterium]